MLVFYTKSVKIFDRYSVLVNLFSSFDPGMGVGYRVFSLGFWVLCACLTFPVLFGRFVESVRMGVVFGLMSGVGVSIIKGVKVLGVGLLVSVFVLVVSVNLSGLVPWVVSLSSQLVFTVCLGLPLWLGSFIMTCGLILVKLAGLIGSGLPLVLAPVIGVIEVSSQLIRPVTLSLRLAANMMAGHIIMALLMGAALGGTVFLFFVVGIYLFEMAICVVQAFVFVLLLSIYVRE